MGTAPPSGFPPVPNQPPPPQPCITIAPPRLTKGIGAERMKKIHAYYVKEAAKQFQAGKDARDAEIVAAKMSLVYNADTKPGESA